MTESRTTPKTDPAEYTAKGKAIPDQGNSAQDAEALNWFQKGCDGGDMEGCAMLALMHKYGRGTAKDEARAVSLYRKSCSGGHAPGCFNAGLMSKVGLGTAANWDDAAGYYQKGCHGGNSMACRELATAHRTGEGRAKDLARAAHFLQKGCASDDMLREASCEQRKELCTGNAFPACAQQKTNTHKAP